MNSNNLSTDCKKLQPEIEINEYMSSKKLLTLSDSITLLVRNDLMNTWLMTLDWVLSHWAHFTVLRFIFVWCITVCFMHAYACNTVRWTWWD